MSQNFLVTSELFREGYGLISKRLMRDKSLSIESKAIYSYLASFSGAGMTSFPSRELMCSELNISINRFTKYRKELVESGYVTITRERTDKGFSKNIYILNHEPTKVKKSLCTQNVDIQNVDIRNVDIQNEDTISNSFISNSLNNNSTKKESVKKSRKRTYDAHSVEMKLAVLLYEKIKADIDIAEPNLQNWADHIRLMIERDKREPKHIAQMIQFAREDDFWKSNILSTQKLRKNFDTLQAQYQAKLSKVSQPRFNRSYKQNNSRKESMPDWATQEVTETPVSEAEQEAIRKRIEAMKKSVEGD
ncbi:helix-turn-helix domain-containing protein [Vagococcus lutrae]|uniref:helix-turn-helix domain-containing protein n=1 Tax=Vagococcus lutrae TaxID=81947 RepID=UPI00288D6516|nr:helix-turn-helix domain-containing protein [Vagococcus lutrae]MDT2824847.1 helix-turn-helix domain-containing protein [Vagococcus lutrae]